mmetsp:Transcript_55644/g.158466  ORF Transcript_55644/g.158466 Transcript_55644/m.158466 type:complete len:209 (-) Transcript_55644:467-1093(-)
MSQRDRPSCAAASSPPAAASSCTLADTTPRCASGEARRLKSGFARGRAAGPSSTCRARTWGTSGAPAGTGRAASTPCPPRTSPGTSCAPRRSGWTTTRTWCGWPRPPCRSTPTLATWSPGGSCASGSGAGPSSGSWTTSSSTQCGGACPPWGPTRRRRAPGAPLSTSPPAPAWYPRARMRSACGSRSLRATPRAARGAPCPSTSTAAA